MKSAPDIIKKALPNSPSPRGRMFRMLLSCLIGLLVLSSQALGQGAVLEFAPATVTVDPNTNTNTVFTVDVQVNGSGQFDAVEAYLTFDPAVLQITNETLTASGLTVISNVENNTLGTYEFVGVSLGSNLSTGTSIVTLEFTVIGTSSPTEVDFNGASPINPSILTSVQLDGQDVLVGTTPLSVTINSNNTAPVVNITNPTDNATVTRGSSITFEATVTDTEEPGLGSTLSWSSSDVAFSGSQAGLSITDQLLEPGPQTITASITDGGGLEGTDEITVNVSCPQLSFVSPTEGGNVSGTSVDVEVSAIDVLFGTLQNANEHFHFFINPPDLNNLNQDKRISTANDGPQTSFTFDENSGSLAFDGNGNGIVLGANTIVVVAAQANHTEFTCTGAKAIVNFTVAAANTIPVITLDATASVSEGGSISVPLSITDSDGDALTVSITSVSNEPQDLQSGNTGKQVDPYPTTAAGFFSEGGIGSAAGTYNSSLTFAPTFGDGGSNGDGSAVYTVTVSVSDEDGNTITQDLDVTVNDTDQTVSGGTTKIEAESFDEQGPDNLTGTGDAKGIGVEIDPLGFTNIGFTNVGDFAEYEIDVQTAGTYQLDLFVGVPGAAGVPTTKVMDISSNGNVVGTFTANGTATGNAGFGTYVTQSLQITLPAGPQTLRFDWVGGTGFLFNIDYFELSPVANQAPVFDLVISDQTNLEGDVISLDGSATDPETDNITYSATGLPAGLGISTITGEISGTITVGAAANSPYAVTITATDDGSPIASATQSFQWTVTTVAVNNPPVIVGATDAELDEGETLQLGLQVNDDTDPSATIAIYDKSVPGGTNNPSTPNPSGEVPSSDYTFTESSPGSGSYQLTWSPGAGEGRSYLARVTADDGVNPAVVEEFNIDVAQTVPGIILARTFTSPVPWYGPNPTAGLISIEPAGNIGYVDPGEFAEYLIDVPAAGTYELRVNASKGNNTGGNPATLTVSEESGGGFSSIGTLPIDNEGWANFKDYNTTVVFSNAGLQTLRLDFGGGMNLNELEFTSPTGTQIPVFTAEIPNQINLEGDTPTGLAVAANDPDGGAAVTFSDNGTLPPGLSIDPNTGAISGTISAGAAANSPYAVVITATDDETEINTSSFTWTVTVPATFPICVNCGNLPGPITAFGRSFSADQYLTSASSNFNKAAGTAIAGVITGSGEHTLFRSEKYNDPLTYAIPTGNGDFTIELYFSELFIGSAGGGSGLGAGDRLFDIDVEGSTETGIDLFTEYGPLVAATKTFTVTVTDGFLNIDLDATEDNAKLNGFCITETSNFVANAAPTISIEPVTDLLDCEGDGEDITLTADANDAEQGDMDALIIWKDGSGTPVGTGPTLVLTAATGSETYTAEVTDATPATATESVTVNVIVNTAPVLSAITANPTTIDAGSTVSLSVSQADDAEDGSLAVSWTSDIEPAGAIGTGPSLTPTLTEVGEHTITATITDACGVEITQTTTVQVNAVSNDAPVLTIVSPLDNTLLQDCEADGELVNLEATVTDAEDDDNTLAATISWTLGVAGPSLGTGATVNGVSLVVGTNVLVATVTDSDNNTVSQSVTVEVTGNTAPLISNLTVAPTTIFVGAAVALSATATDVEDDDNTLVVNWSSSLETANNGDLGSGASLNPILTVEGEHTITASVTDACGQETTETVTVTVIPVEVCAISAITVDNISECNPADDTFTADVTVAFSTAPTTGTLDLTGDGTASIDVTSLQGESHTFTSVQMVADGSAIILEAEFSDEEACDLININAGTAPEACSIVPCSISELSVDNISACNNNGTIETTDDTYTADVTVSFAGAPATGTLELLGDGTASVDVSALTGSTYTFTGVSMPADGGAISLTAFFSEDELCTTLAINLGTAPVSCSETVCEISDIAVANISACSDAGTDVLTDDTFTADVTVTFINAPATGTLDLTGAGTASVDVSNLVGTTHTFVGVSMPADGTAISLTAAFSEDGACSLENANAGTAPEACSISAEPCARVAFDTGGGLAGSSTFGGGLFITNNSVGNVNISSVTIDLGTAVLPNVVFDPVGTAGDATAQCVTLIAQTGGNGNVGLTIPGNNGSGTDPDCVDPFSVPNGPGGYEVMTLDFTEFEPGETVNIAVDVDPRSIEGFNAAGNAGAIAGTELIGSTVTVTYSDGSTATRQLYQVGTSLVNSENFFSPATPQCAAPSLAIGGVTGNGTITDVSQTATITGPANANLEILVYGMTLEDLGPNGAPTDPFEMNKTQSLLTTTATIGGTGTVDVPLNLSGTSDQQIYYIIATIIPEADDCGQGACDISNVVRLQIVEPVCELTALTVDNISACDDSGSADLGDDTFTADVTVTFVDAPATGTLDLTGDGTATVDASTLVGETSYTFVGVSMIADGGDISLSATFSADGACTIENLTAGTAPVACSTDPCARVAFDTGGGLAGSSTFGGGLFITNNSTGNINISSVSIDLGTAVLPNVVFDPVGTAGDATAQCVTLIAQTGGNGNVGLTIPGNNGSGTDPDCVTPFSVPNGPGGYEVMTLDFTEFEPGETVNIAVDVDPRSIEGFNAAGNAGAIAGSELIGSTVTVTYSDGSTATRQLYQVGNSLVNSENFFSPATPQCSAPALTIGGVTGNGQITEASQTATITGPANANLEILVYGMTLEDLGPNGAPADPFEMNKTQSLQTLTATVGGTGTVDVPLNLSGTSDQQIYYIIATIIPEADDCGQGACDISNVVRLQIVEPVCELTALTVDNISACNDETTPDLGDDTFTADVTVTFANPPATGTLDLSGDGTGTVDASTLAGETSYTFVGVSMSADGGAISLTAAFSADGACSIDNADAGTAPEACSVQPCELNALTVANISACNDETTPDLGDDTFTADVTVTFANPPATGTLDLSGDGTATVDASTLAGETSYTFVGVSMSADGGAISLTAAFSADGACSIDNADAGTAPEACSVQPCELNALTVANISACNDETTPDLGDDTFTADVTVTFANPPATGTLDLSGDGTGTVDASTLAGETSYTFVGVSMSADGGAISLTAAFSADGACSIDNADAGTAPEACSVPPAPVFFWLEAECAVVGSNWNTVSDSDASNGEYVTIQNGNNTLNNPPADIPANQVEFTVELTADQAADFHLFARINAPGSNDDSFWVRVNGGSWIKWWQGLTTSGGFAWREVLDSPFAFTAGANTIEFAYREDGTLLDKIYVSTDSALPTTIGPEGVNCVPNAAPIAAFTADPLTGTAPLTVSFDATGSSDADGTIVSYAWDFDGATATETSPLTSFTFDTPGTYVVSLVVTDNDGATSTNVAQVTIVVDEVPDADDDGIADAVDNCPNTPNPDQADFDEDGIGDLCDTDADGDGFDNTVDCDDFNAAINPGATDIPDNGIDEDCDGEDATTTGSAVFWLEAECADVGSNWTTVSDNDASNGEYVTPQNGFNSLSSPPADVPANQIGFTLNLSASEVGDYYLFARIEAPTSNDNSFWVRINGGNWIQWWQGLDTQNGFEWKEVLNSPFGLVEGNNTVEFAYREDGTLLDKIYLSGNSAGPSAIGPEGLNCTASNELPIASFFATPLTGNAPLDVSLNASASSDGDGNIVTYSWEVDGPVAAAFTETTPLSSFPFDVAGIYTVTLTVTDNDGGVSTNTATATIVVSPQEEPDADEDGVPDATDNCVNTPNPDQTDLDNDGIGDVCDADADGDGFNAGLDCNDFDAAINPEATDIPDNGIDENCDGQDATTSEDATFWLEAECAEVGANWDTTVDPSASNGAYVSIKSGFNSLFVPPSANPANIVKFTVNLTPAQVGSYYVLARIQAPSNSDDSFWVRVNGGIWIQWWQNLATGNSFDWREVAESPFNLTAGDNIIEFAYREDGTLLDKILVSSELQFPTGFGGTAPACDITTNQPPVASFFATPLSGTAPLTVDFDASASTDLDGNVVIYSWDFGPVTGADNTPQIAYTFTEPGTYLVSLVVTDNEGATSTNTATATIVVNPANEPDADQDGVPDSEDNCPTIPNPNQADLDNDGIGNLCDTDADGDGFDESIDCDDFNPDVNNGAVEICDGIDNDCDGLTDEDGVCDGCNTQLISFNNFDNSWGIWNDGGSDCRRSLNDAEFAFGGTGRPVRLRDNSSTSVMTTDNLNLTAYTELTVAFTYLPISMDSETEDFFLEISTDGGNTFNVVEEWNEGDEFENGIRYFEEVTINGAFTTETQLRFRCDASGNSDWVYIDNVEISGCFSPAGLIETVQPTARTAKEEIVQPGTINVQEELPAAVSTDLQLFPNPVQDELTVKFGVTKLSDVTLIITDLQGQRIKQQRMDGIEGTVETSLMVDRLPAGIYLLHVITPTGRQTEKFVVSKQ